MGDNRIGTDEIKKSIKEAGDDLELTQEISGRGARTQKAVVERLRTAMDAALESIDREGELFIGNVPREHDEGAHATETPATERRLEEIEEAERLARDEKVDVGQIPSTLTEEPGVSRVQLTAENHVQGQGEVRHETVPTTLTGIPTTETTARGVANEPSTSDTRSLLLTAMARGDVSCAFQLQRARLDLHPELGETPDLDPRILWVSLLLTPSGAETLVFWVSQPLPWLVAPKDVPLMTRRGDLKLSHGATAKARENAVKQDRVPTTNAIKSP